MSLVDNIDKVAYSSTFPSDKIIAVYTGTFTALAGASGAARGTLSAALDLTTEFAVADYFTQMIWSDDNLVWVPGGNPLNTTRTQPFNNNGAELVCVPLVYRGNIYAHAANQRTSDVLVYFRIVVYDSNGTVY